MPNAKANTIAQKERASRMAPERRRDQLIKCAVRVFARNGIGNAGHALVAEEAGVSTPMPNRQALIDMAFQDRVIARFESIIDNAIARAELSEDVSSISGSHLIMGSANIIAQMKFRVRSEQEIDSFLVALVRGALPKNA